MTDTRKKQLEKEGFDMKKLDKIAEKCINIMIDEDLVFKEAEITIKCMAGILENFERTLPRIKLSNFSI